MKVLHILGWMTFFAFCKRNNWEMDRIKTGNLLKSLDYL